MNKPEHHKINQLVGDEPFIDPMNKMSPAAKLMAPKLLPRLRKAGRVAAVYALSYLAVKALDAAAETHPSNKFINGADQIANVVFGFENLAVGGVILIAEAGYEAATRPKPAPIEPPMQHTEPATKEPPLPKHPHHRRNHAPMNATLMPELSKPANKTNPVPQPQDKASPFPKAAPAPRYG